VTYADRPRGAPIVVYDESPMTKTGFRDHVPPRGRLEFRSAEQIGVSVDDRVITVVVMPAEEPALVPHPNGDRMITEIVSHHAFAGTEERAGRVKVNRDHDITRVCGRATALDPYSELGLVGELKIAKTELGDETLQLAREEVLDCSAGFLPLPDGEHWEHRNRRRLDKCWLGHVSLVADPAFEGARVLSVRGDSASASSAAVSAAHAAVSATPNLDRLRALELADKLRP
jgi:HK97 family phage prohead protease